MTNAIHSQQTTTEGIHIPYAWSYANAAARTGATGFVAGDVGKFARQTDNNSIWMLTATTPTWKAIAAESRAVINDTKTSGTFGGGFTSGAWQTRDLNTEQSDVDSIVSIASNQFTLAAGTYYVYATAPAYAVDRHRIRLYNATDAAVIAYGTSEYVTPVLLSAAAQTISVLSAVFTITGSKALEIQHRCHTTNGVNGFGIESSMAAEIYTVVTIVRLA